MALSINDVLRELESADEPNKGQSVQISTTSAVTVPTNTIVETDPEKVASYLDALATPDSLIDELAKLAVLQDFIEENNIPMDKVASIPMEIRNDSYISMLKVASELIRETAQLREKMQVRDQAEKLAKLLSAGGHIDQSDILDKVVSFRATGIKFTSLSGGMNPTINGFVFLLEAVKVPKVSELLSASPKLICLSSKPRENSKDGAGVTI